MNCDCPILTLVTFLPLLGAIILLFINGEKQERIKRVALAVAIIDFIISSLESEYEIVKIGIAERIDEDITYNDLNDMNIIRDDSLGEFLNRPIFIMKSKCK